MGDMEMRSRVGPGPLTMERGHRAFSFSMEGAEFVKTRFLAIFRLLSYFNATQSSTEIGGLVPLDFWHFLSFNRVS